MKRWRKKNAREELIMSSGVMMMGRKGGSCDHWSKNLQQSLPIFHTSPCFVRRKFCENVEVCSPPCPLNFTAPWQTTITVDCPVWLLSGTGWQSYESRECSLAGRDW